MNRASFLVWRKGTALLSGPLGRLGGGDMSAFQVVGGTEHMQLHLVAGEVKEADAHIAVASLERSEDLLDACPDRRNQLVPQGLPARQAALVLVASMQDPVLDAGCLQPLAPL